MEKLTHLDDKGAARMVDVSSKDVTEREATAEALVILSAEAFAAVREGNAPKGDVLATARIAGIMAAKKTPDLIPLCHPLSLSKADVDFEWLDDRSAIRVTALAKTTGQTGVEMEALIAASVAALTIYDMVKAIDKGTSIEAIRLVRKSGGKSRDYKASAKPTLPTRRSVKPRTLMGEVSAPRPGPDAQREAFRSFMTSQRLRATDWAKSAGVPAAQIYAFLTGRSRGLSADVAERLARVARVRVEDMFR
jgi:cyclic pyranopterin monophosphate synthase